MNANFVKFIRNRNKQGKIQYKAESYGTDIITPFETVTFTEQFKDLNEAREWLSEQEKASGFNHTGSSDPTVDAKNSVSLLKWLKTHFDNNKTE